MSHILQIVVNIFSLIAILGLAGWFFIRAFKRSTDPASLAWQWVLTLGLGIPMAVVIVRLMKAGFAAGGLGGAVVAIGGLFLVVALGFIMYMIWRNSIFDMIASPITSLIDGGNVPPEPKPYYSIALAKRKSYRPLEAIVEIRKQLAQFPNDYEGIHLLAAIQAEDLKDLPCAEITLNLFCDSPAAPSKQVAAALTQLADWHLKLAHDADSARAALEEIIAKFPGSELALAAAQRIAHLGGVEKILLAAQDRQPMAMPEGVKSIGLRDSLRDLIPAETDPAKLAADYVKHLEQHPLDTEAREKLAILYAAHYRRLDLATIELAQLINEPNQPPKHVAHWLNLLADLQIRSGADYDTVRPTLEKIIEHFPGMAVAELAQSRLNCLKLEIKGKKETPDVKLGVYEQNIGLKYGSPH
jgi:tetratricopeptide (TPR) repeat protein